jgi:nucleoside-diphosphate-sugar epimerase
MSTEHSFLRSVKDNVSECERLLSRFDVKDLTYIFTTDDAHTLRGIATMAAQAAKNSAELSGYVEALLYRQRK